MPYTIKVYYIIATTNLHWHYGILVLDDKLTERGLNLVVTVLFKYASQKKERDNSVEH